MEDKEYKKILEEYIPKLNGDIPHAQGSDGTAYFVSDEFVIKDYDNIREKDRFLIDNIFEDYAEEQMSYSKKGFSLAKIYAYLRDCSKAYTQNFYLLEERVKGKNPVYFIDLKDSYNDYFKNEYTRDEFNQIVENIECNLPAFEHIFKEYTKYFINSNNMLESMSDEVIERFIYEQLEMYYGNYSYPDLFSVNTFISDNQIKTIDNHMSYRQFDSYMPLDDNIIRSDLAYHILNFARDNQSVSLSNEQLSKMDAESSKEIRELIDFNRKLCDAFLKKFSKAMIKVVGKVVLPKEKYDELGREVAKVVGDKQKVTEIMSGVEREK